MTDAEFGPTQVAYTTYDPRSTEVLQLGRCVPTRVTAGGVQLTRVAVGGGGGGPEGWWSLGPLGEVTVFKAGAKDVVVACAAHSG